MIFVFSKCKKIISQFFDLDIENPLGRGTLAKIESSLYLLGKSTWTWKSSELSEFKKTFRGFYQLSSQIIWP
jgi:hypothetical protein